MPTDTKRVTGPQESVNVSSVSGDAANLVTFTERKHGRENHKNRPIFIKTQVTSQARGSAYIEMSNTKVICAVYGPRESIRREDFSMTGQLSCDLKFAPFSCPTRRQHQHDQQEKEMCDILVKALKSAVRLERYPKGVLDICIKVLENDGNVLSAALTAASVALASAGIEMYDLVIGACARVHNDQILVDPTYDEEHRLKVTDAENDGSMTIGYMTSLNQVSAVTMSGQVSIDSATNCLKACMESCYQIYPVVQKALQDDIVERMEST